MNAVKIANNEFEVKEYNGLRLVTLDDVDKVHNRPKGTAKRNFNQHKEQLVKDEDYFEISPYEIRTNKIMQISNALRRDMIFLTEMGYLMLVKSFTDDLAWKVQRQLVNNYFRVKQEPTQLTIEPIAELQRKTYKGIPVMVINDLAQVLGLSKYTAYWRVRQSNIPYIVLQGKNLFDFKAENSGFAVQTKSLAIMFYEDVLEFCRVLNLDTTMVIKYFEGSIVVKRDSRNVPSDNDYKKAEFMLKASETLQDKKMANFVAMEALKLIAGESIVEDYDIVVILNEVIHMTKGKSLNQIKAMKKDAEEMMKKENASSEVKEFMMSVFDRAILRKMF